MKKFYTIILSLIVFNNLSFSQIPMVVNRDWVRNFSEKDQITNVPSAIDEDGNIYVTGYSFIGGTNWNYTTIKYNQQGDTLWIRHYNGTANSADLATAIALDNSGNVYITGKSIGTGTNFDYVTIKYNSAGVQLWASRYNGTGNGYDEATAIAVDNVGNVFVTGYSTGTGSLEDYATVKYNSSGVQQWVQRYNGTGNGFDKATALTINTNNRIIVTGFSTNTSGKLDAVTLRYNSGNGNIQWTKIYTGSFNGDDVANSIINDGINIIICGSTQITATNSDYLILKYNTSNANQIFIKTYDGYGVNDYANSMAIDNTGNFYVTGVCKNNTLIEYHTLEFNNSGVQQWVHKYPLNLPNTNIINKVAIDTWDMIYVCGETRGTSSRDFVLYQLNGNGGQQWVETYNGIANGQDAINDMVVDNSGHIFVTGQTFNGNAKFDFTTIKYSQTPVFFPPDYNNEIAPNSFTFNENKGQLINTQNQFIPEIRFYTTNSYPDLFISDTKLSYVFSKIDTIGTTPDTLHRIDMSFVKGNPNTKAFPFEMKDSYTNYFLAHCPQGITDAKGFTRLLIPNIYPNIDLHYYSNSKGLKYYFVVKLGGNPKDIYLQYDGATGIEITTGGNMILKSSIGQISHDRPNAYQINFAQNIIPLNWNADWIQENSNTVHFNIGNYNTSLPLIIQVDLGHYQLLQPSNIDNLEWCSYFGGSGTDYFRDVDSDGQGKLAAVGYTMSTNFPVTPGVIQDTINGKDAMIVKFDSSAVLLWATYYGGTGSEEAYGTKYDKFGNIYITGYTGSTNFSTFKPAGSNKFLKDTFSGGFYESFIIKLNQQGNARLWATYFGAENGTDLVLDGYYNLYLVGQGFRQTKTQTGAYNSQQGSGFIAKFNSEDSLVWATQFGGLANSTVIWGNAVDYENNLFITGGTTSSGFSIYPAGNSSFAGGCEDAFISKFTAANALSWSTYFGGDDCDKGISITTDSSGNVFVVGQTLSSNVKIPLTNPGYPAFFQDSLAGGTNSGDGFICKFSNSGTRLWSTYFGGAYDEEFWKIILDNHNNFYITGITKSGVLPFLTSNPLNAYSNLTYNLYDDAFILTFNSSLERIWTTYFGGGFRDWGTSINISVNSKLYLVGMTNSHQGPFPLRQLLEPANAWWQSTTLQSNAGFIARFDLHPIYNTGIIEYKENISGNLQIYPNPTQNFINIRYETQQKKPVVITIFNTLGARIYEETISNVNGTLNKQINLDRFDNSIYIIQLKCGDQILGKKIFKY